MFLTPDGAPFFGGTYFPKEPRYNLPGFPQLLERVAQIYRENREEIGRQNETILATFESMQPGAPAHHSELSPAPIDAALRSFEDEFRLAPRRLRRGAQVSAPRGARVLPAAIGRGRRRHGAARSRRIRSSAWPSGDLRPVGRGFARYSVDGQWMIPHFEKMLYDNGPLLRLCSDAWTATKNPLFARVAEETAAWVMREMQSPRAATTRSLDADSEHEEGKFYVWTAQEVQAGLSPEEYAVLAPHYGLDGPPNFEARIGTCTSRFA